MILITGANGWLGLNLVDSIRNGRTKKWGQNQDDIKAFVLRGTDKSRLLKIAPDVKQEELSLFSLPENCLVSYDNSFSVFVRKLSFLPVVKIILYPNLSHLSIASFVFGNSSCPWQVA